MGDGYLFAELEGGTHDVIPTETYNQCNFERVARTEKNGDFVDTAFLGLAINEEHPKWFQTIVIGGKSDGYHLKTATYDEAMTAHWATCALEFGPDSAGETHGA